MDPAIRFLSELAVQQERDPNQEPSAQSVVNALRAGNDDGEQLLEELLEHGLVQVLPTPRRGGDGPLDGLLKITRAGRDVLDRAPSGSGAEDPTMRFLQAVHDDLESRSQNRIDASVVAQSLRLRQEDAAAIIEQLVDLDLLKAHNSKPRLSSAELRHIVELTPMGRHAISTIRASHVGSEPGTPLADSYTTRDLPVLREASRVLDSEAGMHGLRFGQLVDATGMPPIEVELALRAIEADDLLEVRWAHPREASRVFGLTSAARERGGLWPTPETALDRMITALEAIAANTNEDEDTRTKAQKFAAWLRSGATTVGIGVATAAISGQIPG